LSQKLVEDSFGFLLRRCVLAILDQLPDQGFFRRGCAGSPTRRLGRLHRREVLHPFSGVHTHLLDACSIKDSFSRPF
jgi:hypothetical protein